MINWAEIDQDFLTVAKSYQDRYDGKGSFLEPGQVREAEKTPSEDDYANAYAKFEVFVMPGEPEKPNGGMPVRFEVKDGEQTRWALGWLPSCAVSESEGFTEGGLAFVSAYLKENAAAMFEHYFKRCAANQETEESAN